MPSGASRGIGASGGIGAPRDVGALGCCWEHWSHQGMKVSGVNWGLVGSVGAQGPAGV